MSIVDDVNRARTEAGERLGEYPTRTRGHIKRHLATAAEKGRIDLYRPLDEGERSRLFERAVHDAMVTAVGDGRPIVLAIDGAVACSDILAMKNRATWMQNAVSWLEGFSELSEGEEAALDEAGAREADFMAGLAENAERAAEADTEIAAPTPGFHDPRL